MNLTHDQTKELERALYQSIPNLGELEYLVEQKFNQRLEEIIVINGPFSVIVSNIVYWANSNGNLAELISAVLIEYPERSKLEEVAVELNLLTDSIHLVVLKNALEKMRKDHLQQIAQLQVEIESARAKAAQTDVLSLEVQVYRDELNKAHQDLVAAELRNSELEEQLVVFTTRPAYPQELTPPQHKKLHAALQQAFPDLAELNRLVSVELGQNLVAICGNGTLADQIHCLVQWAEARGDLPVLLTAVAEARPRNHHLKAFFNSLPSGSTKLT